MDTHADATRAYAAADAMGWMPAPELGNTFKQGTGNSEGRSTHVGDPPALRAVAASESGAAPVQTCFMVARSDAAADVEALSRLVGAAPDHQKDGQASWSLFVDGDRFGQWKNLSPGQFARRSETNPSVDIVLTELPSNPGYLVLRYQESSAMMRPPWAAPADSGDMSHYAAWIEQDGKSFPLKGEVHLKRRPFTLVFSGSYVLTYSLYASLDRKAFANGAGEAALDETFNRFKAGAERQHDTALFVNPATPIPEPLLVHHAWSNFGHGHPFSSSERKDGGVEVSRRDVDTVLVKTGSEVALADWTMGPIYLMVAISTPQPGSAFAAPKQAKLVFN